MKRYYPDLKRLRAQIEDAFAAMGELLDRDIPIRSIAFRGTNPLIVVEDCHATQHLRGAYVGQGVDQDGRYEHRAAVVAGCQVQWRISK